MWVEIECTVHAALANRLINQFKLVKQSRRQALRAYCPNNIYFCFLGKCENPLPTLGHSTSAGEHSENGRFFTSSSQALVITTPPPIIKATTAISGTDYFKSFYKQSYISTYPKRTMKTERSCLAYILMRSESNDAFSMSN